MRIALVGNMNNNHFAFMRYLRDLGHDAHLFLYKNEQEHFHPSMDTWDFSKWEQCIHHTSMMNGTTKKDFSVLYSKRKDDIEKLREYDLIICNGSFPVYARRLKLNIDYFLPYGVGIEFLNIRRNSIFTLILSSVMRFFQKRAINESVRRIVTIDFTEENLKNFNYLKQEPTIMGIPMLYDLESPNDKHIEHLKPLIDQLKASKLVVFSHVSHIWKNIPSSWTISIKQNEILIQGFAEYIKNTNDTEAILVLIEYGTDVDASKELIQEFGIEEFVLWIPAMSRKEIMVLLDYVDLGAGEFGGLLWGGTGWEFMSKGVPFFQYVKIDPKEYESKSGQPFPNFINTNAPSEIAEHIGNFRKDSQPYVDQGNSLKKWFENHAGKRLAERYIQLIEEE